MIPALLCAFALLLGYFAGRRSLVHGLVAVVGVGYVYGILRANFTGALSHFIFDSAVVGFYATLIPPRVPAMDRRRIRRLMPWLALLMGWPLLLLLVPLQDPMVQLVGLRAHIFLLPFLWVGARLHRSDLEPLLRWLAAFNLFVFLVAVAEFLLGIQRFYPRNAVTELIYRSNDVVTSDVLGAYRIPATFANSSSYGATMVMTIPLLLGAWVQRDRPKSQRIWLTVALAVTILGVFMAASRSHFMVLAVLLLVSSFSGRLGATGRVAWAGLLAGLGWAISSEGRLFERFLSLNLDTILVRLSWGVNASFFDAMFRYPLGNGLGGGGTSLPYFLQHLLRDPQWMENQYGNILLEQGVPGLLIWVAFLVWVMTRRTTARSDPWYFGRRLVWYTAGCYFAQALIGIGLLTSIPSTVLLLALIGWFVVPQDRGEVASRPVAPAEVTSPAADVPARAHV